MLTNFADNYFLNDYITTVYNKYLLQSPAILFNYYCITKLSKYTSNYSSYKQYSSNTFYDCLLLTEGFQSTNVTQRTQSGETNIPFYSLDQIEIIVPAHIFTPTVGDKVTFSTDITTLLSRKNSRVFEVTQIEIPTPFIQTKNVCKVICNISTNANEELLQKYTLMNYVYLPFSKKYCKLQHYVTILSIIEQVKRILDELNKRYLNNFFVDNETCILDPSYVFAYLLNKVGCQPDSLTGITRLLNMKPLFYKQIQDNLQNQELNLNQLSITFDLVRKYPFITKYTNTIKPSFTTSSTNIQNYVSQNTLDTFHLVRQINCYNDKNEQIANVILDSLKTLNLSNKNAIEILMYLVILLKLENILLYDYSR